MPICSACAHLNARASTRCGSCGAALGRSDEVAARALRIAVKRAQAAMLLVVTVQVFGVLYLWLTEGLSAAMMAVMLLFAAVYVGLWAWSPRKPLAASLVGLVVFVVVHAIEAVLDPAALARGLVIIVGITLVLAWAVAGGLAHRERVRGR